MFDTLASAVPYVIAGLMVSTFYMFRRWTAVASIAQRRMRVMRRQAATIEDMQREGCAAADLVQNVFNSLTSPNAMVFGASLDVQAEMSAACGTLLLDATRCECKEEADDLREAVVRVGDDAERLAGELQVAMTSIHGLKCAANVAMTRAEEAERLLELVNDKLVVSESDVHRMVEHNASREPRLDLSHDEEADARLQ